MTFTRITLSAALAAATGLTFAADSPSARQERMDAAYQSYLATQGQNTSGTRNETGTYGSASPDAGGTGHIKDDAKTFGRGMKDGVKKTGRSIARGARKTGHDFAEKGREIKDKATGDD